LRQRFELCYEFKKRNDAAYWTLVQYRARVLPTFRSALVSLAVATNRLAALTRSASGGLTIALDALGQQ